MKLLDSDPLINIIFEDNHILVLDKPSGLLTQPDSSVADSLEERAKKYIKQKYEKKGDVFLHALHRLDRQVSGIVLFARTSKALARLNEQMRNKKIIKKYMALIEGNISEEKGRLVNFLVHESHRARVSSKEDKEAKRAELFYELLSKEGDGSLVSIELITGRYHQIRAQMAHFGHPILGDEKYGSRCKKEEIALHCCLIEFTHPVSNKKMTFLSKAPFVHQKAISNKKKRV